jgi:hypothetical protein
LIANFGHVPIKTNCLYGFINCDAAIEGDSKIVEKIIKVMGDTYDAYLDEKNSLNDIAIDGAGYTRRILGDAPMTQSIDRVGSGYIGDREIIYRDTVHNVSDSHDVVLPASYHLSKASNSSYAGSFLVRPSSDYIPASGDLDNNRNLTIKDFLLLERYLLKLDAPNEGEVIAGDIDRDGKIMIGDFLLLQKRLLE